MSSRSLYLASTPMIALEAAGAALAQGGRAHLVLIEDFDLATRLADLLQRWRDCPFEAIHRVPGRYTEYRRDAGDDRHAVGDFVHRIRTKRALRTESLASLDRIEQEFQPDSVWVGNDRKVETQYALHLASERLKTRPGRYLDDGLCTYLGDVRRRPQFRLRTDWLVKRITYGPFWHTVAQAGTSPWIAESWLAFPGQALDRDACRTRRVLPPSWFTGRPFLRLSALAAAEFAVDRVALGKCAIVLVLPHSNHIRGNPAVRTALVGAVAAAGERGQRVAVKYHPREVDADPAGLLAGGNAVALPTLLPMELLLPLLPPGAVLCGEGSTALLAAHWLRPDLQVFDLGLSGDGYAARARDFFLQHGIPSIAGDFSALAAAN
jgi:hypothetical protein